MMHKLPLKADHVGSLLRSAPIQSARKAYQQKEMTQAELTKVENIEIKKLVQKQIDIGLKAITDGEFRRLFWSHDFFVGLDGIEFIEVDRGIRFSDGVKTKPIAFEIVDKIKFNHHYMIEHFKFLKQTVDELGDGSQVAKFTIPAPSVIMYRYVNEREKVIYPDATDMFKDLARAYQEMVQALYEAGCRYLQFDDTTLTTFTDPKFSTMMVETTGLALPELLHTIIETTNTALQDKPEDLTTTVHMCRGNFRSKSMHADGGYDYVAPFFDQLNYDAFFLEYDDERSGGFEPLKDIKRRDVEIVLGLITSKTPTLEDVDYIKNRIQQASRFIPKENLALSPQCGFASTEEGNDLTVEQQWAKLSHVIKIAEDVWN